MQIRATLCCKASLGGLFLLRGDRGCRDIYGLGEIAGEKLEGWGEKSVARM